MAIIHDFRPSVAATSTQSVSSTTGAAAPPTAPPQEARPGDNVRLSQPVNPYQGISERTATVRADAWKKGPNGSVEQILAHQGYSREEMYHRDGEGRSLIQRVAEVNGMHDPNLLREGQSLLVPVRPEEAHPAPPAPAQANGNAHANPAANANGNGNASAQVTVDRWGTGPNDSLERILVNQGYSLREIHRKDGDGRTMLDRVASDNNLPNANSLRAGAHLIVPSRRQEGQDQQQGRQDHPTPQPEPEAPPAPHHEPEAPPAPPAPQPETPPAPPAQDENEATAEMGLLLNGAREQKFTRDEFQALNSAANRYEEMRAEYARDGFTNDELRDLGRFEQRYGDMYARFHEHDRSRISFQGGESADPRVQERARLLEESGRLYDGFLNGNISYEDAAGQLMAQRARSRQLGDDQR